jgi:hypothetical protein
VIAIEDIARPGAAVRRLEFSSSEIHGMRLRVVNKDGGGLVLKLTLRSSRVAAQEVNAIFRVAALDRNDEAVELALAMARCLGFEGYRIREGDPPDVELSPTHSAGVDPYRGAATARPIPPAGEAIDFTLFGVHDFVEPEPELPSFEPADAPEDKFTWRVTSWEPGRKIVLSNGGRSALVATLLAALVWFPLALVAWPVVGLMFWSIGMFASEIGLLILAAIAYGVTSVLGFEVGGDVLFMWFFYAMVTLGGVLAVAGLAVSAKPTFGWALDHYHSTVGHRRIFDWAAHELVELAGGRQSNKIPFEDVCGLEVRAQTIQTEIALQRSGQDDLVLLTWSGAEQTAAAKSMATDLARVIQVPVVFNT